MHDRFEKRIYVPLQAGGQITILKVYNHISQDLHVRGAFPVEYDKDYVQLIDGFDYHYSYTNETYDVKDRVYYPYFQTAELYFGSDPDYKVLAYDTHDIVFRNVHLTGHANVMFKVGNEYRVDVMEILTLPISMFQTHGYYWTQHGYFWIFTIVGAASASLYVLLGRLRLWQVVAVYSASAFSIVFFEKLYHAVLAAHHAGSGHEIAYAVVCIALLAEGIPFVFALLFLRQAVCRPIVWSILAIVIGTGFLFLAGSGWFVGTGLLLLAALTRLAQRVIRCAI